MRTLTLPVLGGRGDQWRRAGRTGEHGRQGASARVHGRQVVHGLLDHELDGARRAVLGHSFRRDRRVGGSWR